MYLKPANACKCRHNFIFSQWPACKVISFNWRCQDNKIEDATLVDVCSVRGPIRVAQTVCNTLKRRVRHLHKWCLQLRRGDTIRFCLLTMRCVLEHALIARSWIKIAAAFKGRLTGVRGGEDIRFPPDFDCWNVCEKKYVSSAFFEDPSCTQCNK